MKWNKIIFLIGTDIFFNFKKQYFAEKMFYMVSNFAVVLYLRYSILKLEFGS